MEEANLSADAAHNIALSVIGTSADEARTAVGMLARQRPAVRLAAAHAAFVLAESPNHHELLEKCFQDRRLVDSRCRGRRPSNSGRSKVVVLSELRAPERRCERLALLCLHASSAQHPLAQPVLLNETVVGVKVLRQRAPITLNKSERYSSTAAAQVAQVRRVVPLLRGRVLDRDRAPVHDPCRGKPELR